MLGHALASSQRCAALIASSRGFEYAVEAEPVEPGVWQIFMHHGSAYALGIADKPKFLGAQLAIAGVAATFSINAAAELYWNMRFQALTVKDPLERIVYDPGDLERCINF